MREWGSRASGTIPGGYLKREDRGTAFDRMLVLSAGEPAEVRALSLRELARESAPRVELGGATLTLEWLDRDAGAIRVASVEGGPLHWSGEVYWFVWYAHRERVIASP